MTAATLAVLAAGAAAHAAEPKLEIFDRGNLVAWCVVPFDDRARSPEERAAMLADLGLKRFAYDYRPEHVPTFDAEMEALKRHGIELSAWWFPTTLNDGARHILDVLKRHQIKTQLWVMGSGAPTTSDEEQRARVKSEAARIRPIAEAAAEIGCSVGLYNHGNWFGEPENQIEIIRELGMPNVGIVYNLHHGHDHIERFPALLKAMLPHLYAINLNGMIPGGDKRDQKIVPLGQGPLDLSLLKTIAESGYDGPIGILNHTQENAELRLRDNLDGLEWLVNQLRGGDSGPRPTPRTWKPPQAEPQATRPATPSENAVAAADIPAALADKTNDFETDLIRELLAAARVDGDVERGIELFTSAKLACANCHKVGANGGSIGPELVARARQESDEYLVESVLWPKRKVAKEFAAHTIVTTDGRALQGYIRSEDATKLALLIPATNETLEIPVVDIDERQEMGTLMPDGLAEAMSRSQQLDLIRFLLELRQGDAALASKVEAGIAASHVHAAAQFEFDRRPVRPENWPNWQEYINRDRVYDYYAREADHFLRLAAKPALLPQFPGLDGGTFGHWGNQLEEHWADDRWNDTLLGSVQCGIFRHKRLTVPRGVCVRLGEASELAACFDPETMSYAAVWRVAGANHVTLSDVRHGFVDGLEPNGEVLAIDGHRLEAIEAVRAAPREAVVYHGFYRHGDRTLFAYRVGDTEYLDAPWIDAKGNFQRVALPADEHPLRALTRGGERQWTWEFETAGRLGTQSPFAVDTIPLPFENPWKAMVFCGGHAFRRDGTALVATMQGDVWSVSGLDETLSDIRWKRVASGLHHALGMVIDDDGVFVLGRNQITRLVDHNDDGEIDFYECFSDAYETSTAGHDFICGLERDEQGRFYTVSGNQGVVRISADGLDCEVLATGLRNPDGLAILPDGTVTVPCSEGEWTPTSMICAVSHVQATAPSAAAEAPFFGYRPATVGQRPEYPLVYLPRGLDNSAGSQVAIQGSAWSPFEGLALHLSYGAGSAFLLLTDTVDGQRQGAVVPLATDFRAGAHRGRFSPVDGQLYVSGMGGWGTYTPDDGCFQRVRYVDGTNVGAAEAANMPVGFHVHENGVLVRFQSPLDRAMVERVDNHFAQCWNYRYSSAYGSPELSPSHRGIPGHDRLTIESAHVVEDGRSLFLEMPELQPVNQLHLWLGLGDPSLPIEASRDRREMLLTVNALDRPFTGFDGYAPREKTIAAHPMLADLAMTERAIPNPWRKRNKRAREIKIQAAGNLSFATRSFEVRPGEMIALLLQNPDVVPHNWALVKPGMLRTVGEAANRLVADPDAFLHQYVPQTSDVLCYTDIVPPGDEFVIYFTAPNEPGRYPYLCTFPGHWMVMNGEMIVRE